MVREVPGPKSDLAKRKLQGEKCYCAVFEELLCSFVLYLNFARHFIVCKALLRFVPDLGER